MLRSLSSFSKITFEELHRLAKLDSLNLKNNESGIKLLEHYENILSSSKSCIPKILCKQNIQNRPKFNFELENLTSPTEKQEIMTSKIIETLNLLCSVGNLEVNLIEELLFFGNFSEMYHPLDLKSPKLKLISKKIPQIINILNKSLTEISINKWLKLIERIEFLFNYHQVYKYFMLESEFFQKNPEKLVLAANESELIDLCKFINKVHDIFCDYRVPDEVFEVLIGKDKRNIDSFEDLDLLHLLIAYPVGRDLDHSQYFPRFIENFERIPKNLLIDLAVVMKNADFKIPMELIKQFENSFDLFLLDMHYEKSIYILKKLLKIDKLSTQVLKCFCDHLSKINLKISRLNPIFYDFFSLFYKTKNFHLLLKNMQMVSHLVDIAPLLSPEKNLRIISAFIHHNKDFTDLNPLIESLSKINENFPVNFFPLIVEAQQEFLRYSEENAIYTYQFNSIKVLKNESLNSLAKICNDFISTVNPSHYLISSYYSSLLAESLPPLELLENIQNDNPFWAKLLWQLRDELPTKEIARKALEKVDFFTVSPEVLYYLTSLSPCEIDFDKLSDSDFSLALAYNDAKSPSNFLYKSKNINFRMMPTEAVMKTIVKLVEFNDFKFIKSAIEFVGFVPEKHPRFPSQLLKDFFKSLTEVNPSLINSQSIKVHLMKISEQVPLEELDDIRRFFEYIPKKLIYEFMENSTYKGNFAPSDTSKNLQKCKSFIEKFKTGGLSQNLFHELKTIESLNFAYKDFILSLLKNENFNDPENQSIKVILEILSGTTAEGEILENIINLINKQNTWDLLSFQDLCNLCLLHSKHPIFIPKYIHQHFLSVIYAKVNEEEMIRNPSNNLLYLKPFKYLTELEPRGVISNNILNQKVISVHSSRVEIPYHEVENNIKVLAYLNYLEKPRTPDIDESVRIFFNKRNSIDSVIKKKLAVYEDLVKKYGKFNVEENKIDVNTGWISDFFIASEGIAYKVLTENDYFINSNLQLELKYLTSLMIKQVEKNFTQVISLNSFNYEESKPQEHI